WLFHFSPHPPPPPSFPTRRSSDLDAEGHALAHHRLTHRIQGAVATDGDHYAALFTGQGHGLPCGAGKVGAARHHQQLAAAPGLGDRKSTRLNSSHVKISYAVFCLK